VLVAEAAVQLVALLGVVALVVVVLALHQAQRQPLAR
jgi:hypothetical protein